MHMCDCQLQDREYLMSYSAAVSTGDTNELTPLDDTATDPVCSMSVTLNNGKPSHLWQDDTYHFCSAGCHDKFVADPWFLSLIHI